MEDRVASTVAPSKDGRNAEASTAIGSLPTLSHKPETFPGCCLALSIPLLDHLGTLLSTPSRHTTMSIGSGYGLLEALLRKAPYSVDIIGVEVEPSPNRYLPEDAHRSVHGSRFLEPLAADAVMWLFVYPRRPGLLLEYLAQYGTGCVEKIVWIGPQADWEDYAVCFVHWHVKTYGADKIGGRVWELITVATKV